jgi:RimJ/RimL family protein N-acetyltransferase
MKLNYFQSKNIADYKEVIKALKPIKGFGKLFVDTMKGWCETTDLNEYEYWNVWLVKNKDKMAGVCGLYSLEYNGIDDTYINDLWLAWFGVIERNGGIGSEILNNFLVPTAKQLGCKRLFTYIDKDKAPLNFYLRNGFTIVGSVRTWSNTTMCKLSKKEVKEQFESMNDIVLVRNLK